MTRQLAPIIPRSMVIPFWTVVLKAGSTSGLKLHFQSHHHIEFDTVNAINAEAGVTSKHTGKIGRFFPTKPHEHYFGIQDIKNQFKLAAASWMVEESMPLSMVEANCSSHLTRRLQRLQV